LDFLHAPNKLNVIHEDENIILLDKPAGLLCHADNTEFIDTLIARVLRYLYERGEYDYTALGSFVPALANRIDRNTSGIVIASKNAEALRILNAKIKLREIEKRYLCLVYGAPPPAFRCENYLQKDCRANLVGVFSEPGAGRKYACTEFRMLEKRAGLSLLEAHLITGRTHQIRAQLAHAGYPLVGDGKYGKAGSARAAGIGAQAGKFSGAYKKQFLCAYWLRFSFKTDAGILEYLKGREFKAAEPWFAQAFRAGNL
jgi:23S rRNA pseudouridine955/2504/2580 synthase